MHENALGNHFSNPDWSYLWDGIKATGAPGGKGQKRYHFLCGDMRFNRDYGQASQLSTLTPDDLRRMRLGLGTAFLQDGVYFGFDRGDCLHGQLWWFDEYDANLGKPTSLCRQNGFAEGTWSRSFERGLVIVNPQTQAVTFGTDSVMTDLTTKQRGRRFTIPARDARILTH
jgi:hypothetical protein